MVRCRGLHRGAEASALVSLQAHLLLRPGPCRAVQVLPFCSEETLVQLEKNLSGLPTVTAMLNQGMTVQDITNKWVGGLGACRVCAHDGSGAEGSGAACILWLA